MRQEVGKNHVSEDQVSLIIKSLLCSICQFTCQDDQSELYEEEGGGASTPRRLTEQLTS